jgi:nucleotide-binding universal stress UspA family protein
LELIGFQTARLALNEALVLFTICAEVVLVVVVVTDPEALALPDVPKLKFAKNKAKAASIEAYKLLKLKVIVEPAVIFISATVSTVPSAFDDAGIT